MCSVGLPRAGKSTVALQMMELGAVIKGFRYAHSDKTMAIVSRDSIRQALHGEPFVPELEDKVTEIQIVMTNALFISGHRTVIMDECHLSRNGGKHVLKAFEGCRLIYVDINTPKEVCIERAKATNQEYLIPVIERMACRLEKSND